MAERFAGNAAFWGALPAAVRRGSREKWRQEVNETKIEGCGRHFRERCTFVAREGGLPMGIHTLFMERKMEKKETPFSGHAVNGFLMLFVVLLAVPAAGVAAGLLLPLYVGITLAGLLGIVWIILLCGFMVVEPNEARVMLFFGKYRGTFTRTGYFWVNPFYSNKKLSLRARNLDVAPIKVNDRVGNPVLIGLVVVWHLTDTYRAMFDIDAETMAADDGKKAAGVSNAVADRMKAFESFVKVQSDAALREVAGHYAYDAAESEGDVTTLRGGGPEINERLVRTLNDRLAMAGIEVIEGRINYLAYAPEIAAVMLRRQQASAIVAAREKIVDGAVGMVKLALDKLADEGIVRLDEEKKAAMVGNLLVVLCGDDAAQPVVSTGSAPA